MRIPLPLEQPRRVSLALLVCATFLLPSGLAARADGDDDDDDDDDKEQELTPCEKTAVALRDAARQGAKGDYWIGFAKCINVSDRQDARACFRENRQAYEESLDLLADQFDARLDLCDLLGGERYDPRIDPRDFVEDITNPFLPLVPGTTKIYEKDGEEGVERIEITVTHETKTLLGVNCRVVRDTVTLEGVLIEDTFDYFAQDRSGNVWYFGELSMSFEDGELVDLSGSWRAGVDGAKPGIVMLADPDRGDIYRQEFFPAEAEDAASVSATGRVVNVPAGHFRDCIETFDFTPLSPDSQEAKFYAPGVGVVLEVDLESGERLELIDIF